MSPSPARLERHDGRVSSIEEVKVRLVQLAQDAPISLFDQVNNQIVEMVNGMRGLIAGTNNADLEQALGRLEQGHSLMIDGAVAVVQARDEVWRIAEGL